MRETMKYLWKRLGTMVFWAGIPFLYVYLRSNRRTRVFLVSEGCVLLVKPWMGIDRWMSPGGGLHKDEAPAEGAVREIQEETGVIVMPYTLQHVGSASFRKYGLRYEYEQFVCQLPARVNIRPQRAEILEVTWLPLDQISPETCEQDVLQLHDLWKGLQ